MTDTTTTSAPDSAPDSPAPAPAPAPEPAPAPAPSPAPAPETTLQVIHGDLLAVLAKLENFEHELASAIKARIESIVSDIKEHL